MEDKRTLLAFLAIGLIFLLLPYYNEWMGLNPTPLEEPTLEEALQAQDNLLSRSRANPYRNSNKPPSLVSNSNESLPRPPLSILLGKFPKLQRLSLRLKSSFGLHFKNLYFQLKVGLLLHANF